MAIGVRVASAYDIAFARLPGQAKARRTLFRERAGIRILRTLLRARDDGFKAYKWALYVPLRGGTQIGPLPGLRHENARKWGRGESVTGTAWKNRTRTVGSGAELDRRGKFAAWDGHSNPGIREVVAFPVFNAGGKVIAVLTAGSGFKSLAVHPF